MSAQTVVFKGLDGGEYKPRAYQRAAHAMRLVTRFLVLVWHRRAGKTVFAVLELVLAAAACTKPRGRFAYIAPLLSQGKDVAWDYLKHFGGSIPGAVIRESELAVDLPNGARIRIFGADNPQAFRGKYFDGVVVDEVADIKPNLWGEVLRPALMDRGGWALFIGTPKGVNLFSKLYYDALKGIDAQWGADLKRHSDTGAIPADELEQARREMLPSEWAQEMECDFAAAVDDALVKLDTVLAAQKRRLTADSYHFAGKALGVDVARYGNDRTAITLRQGLIAWAPTVLKQANTMQVAATVGNLIEEKGPDAVFVDAGGIGGGVIDRLQQLGFGALVIPVEFGGAPTNPRFENKRAEMWWDMAEWLKLASVYESTELAQDLTAPRFTYKNARGRFQLESKDHMRARGMKSPDLGDSLATTFASPVVPAGHRRKVHVAQTKYDWRTGAPM